VGLWVIIGFALFFIIERGLHWHHCHKHSGECKVHLFSYMNLLGDGVHNFTDGLAIAVSFLSSTNLGVATTLAVMAHEIPQEISDFGVLVYGGFSKKKALFFNFLSAVMALIGVVVGFFLATGIEYFANYILAFAAGGFIYIAASDLIPELHKEEKLSQSVVSFVFFALGVGFMLLTKLLFEH
ncbi:MAG: ZIP family metal transporter, partial [Patescibacteria group bacterium]